jgi:hypothetical protein
VTRAFALAVLLLVPQARAHQGHPQSHPDVAIRIDQALLETQAVLDAQRRALDGKIRNFKLEIQEDGFHFSGKYRVPILPDVAFHAVASLVWTAPNEFEVRVQKLVVWGLFNVTKQVLDAVQSGLKEALQNVCTFHRLGERPDGSHAMKVTVDMKAMMPTLPTLFLSGITTRDRVIIFKAQLPH